jgi:hypothetical protein
MKKINNSGFVLAETLVVTVFLMIIFGMIYSNFYPLIGEYEKRENYDDVDGVYATYWIKKLIEDSSYDMRAVVGDERYENKVAKKKTYEKYHFWRFECSDVSEADEKRSTCINLVNDLEINGCDRDGNNCDIFITDYRIGKDGDDNDFKDVVEAATLRRYNEECFQATGCEESYITKCVASGSTRAECTTKSSAKVFKSGFQDYVRTLPDYKTESLNGAKYRVIVMYHHIKDNNNYYSYSTTEVYK